jgi:hypothetical protein
MLITNSTDKTENYSEVYKKSDLLHRIKLYEALNTLILTEFLQQVAAVATNFF